MAYGERTRRVEHLAEYLKLQCERSLGWAVVLLNGPDEAAQDAAEEAFRRVAAEIVDGRVPGVRLDFAEGQPE